MAFLSASIINQQLNHSINNDILSKQKTYRYCMERELEYYESSRGRDRHVNQITRGSKKVVFRRVQGGRYRSVRSAEKRKKFIKMKRTNKQSSCSSSSQSQRQMESDQLRIILEELRSQQNKARANSRGKSDLQARVLKQELGEKTASIQALYREIKRQKEYIQLLQSRKPTKQQQQISQVQKKPFVPPILNFKRVQGRNIVTPRSNNIKDDISDLKQKMNALQNAMKQRQRSRSKGRSNSRGRAKPRQVEKERLIYTDRARLPYYHDSREVDIYGLGIQKDLSFNNNFKKERNQEFTDLENQLKKYKRQVENLVIQNQRLKRQVKLKLRQRQLVQSHFESKLPDQGNQDELAIKNKTIKTLEKEILSLKQKLQLEAMNMSLKQKELANVKRENNGLEKRIAILQGEIKNLERVVPGYGQAMQRYPFKGQEYSQKKASRRNIYYEEEPQISIIKDLEIRKLKDMIADAEIRKSQISIQQNVERNYSLKSIQLQGELKLSRRMLQLELDSKSKLENAMQRMAGELNSAHRALDQSNVKRMNMQAMVQRLKAQGDDKKNQIEKLKQQLDKVNIQKFNRQNNRWRGQSPIHKQQDNSAINSQLKRQNQNLQRRINELQRKLQKHQARGSLSRDQKGSQQIKRGREDPHVQYYDNQSQQSKYGTKFNTQQNKHKPRYIHKYQSQFDKKYRDKFQKERRERRNRGDSNSKLRQQKAQRKRLKNRQRRVQMNIRLQNDSQQVDSVFDVPLPIKKDQIQANLKRINEDAAKSKSQMDELWKGLNQMRFKNQIQRRDLADYQAKNKQKAEEIARLQQRMKALQREAEQQKMEKARAKIQLAIQQQKLRGVEDNLTNKINLLQKAEQELSRLAFPISKPSKMASLPQQKQCLEDEQCQQDYESKKRHKRRTKKKRGGDQQSQCQICREQYDREQQCKYGRTRH